MLRSREVHIHPSARENLISAGFIKFGRVPKGVYNIDKAIYNLCTLGGLIPAKFPWIFWNSVVYVMGAGCNLEKAISALSSGGA